MANNINGVPECHNQYLPEIMLTVTDNLCRWNSGGAHCLPHSTQNAKVGAHPHYPGLCV